MPGRTGTFDSIGTFRTDVKYDLPATIKALQDGWLVTFQSSAVIAALFAVIESQLLVFIKDAIRNNIGEDTSSGQALLAFTYLALFLSLGATMSSLLLTDELGSVTLRASRCSASGEDTLRHSIYDEGSSKLLTRFNGGRQSWRWVMWHWLFTLITGYLCLITQLVLYVWCTESSGIKGAVLFIAIVTSIPLLDLLLPIEFFRRQEKATSQQDENNFQQEPKTTFQTPIARQNGSSRV